MALWDSVLDIGEEMDGVATTGRGAWGMEGLNWDMRSLSESKGFCVGFPVRRKAVCSPELQSSLMRYQCSH